MGMSCKKFPSYFGQFLSEWSEGHTPSKDIRDKWSGNLCNNNNNNNNKVISDGQSRDRSMTTTYSNALKQ